jgi:hypothetical protein
LGQLGGLQRLSVGQCADCKPGRRVDEIFAGRQDDALSVLYFPVRGAEIKIRGGIGEDCRQELQFVFAPAGEQVVVDIEIVLQNFADGILAFPIQ